MNKKAIECEMASHEKFQLSETTVNLVENLACQLAEYHSGKIMANHLIPYLPLSLDMIRQCLDNMVDDCAVLRVTPSDGMSYYLFSAFDGKAAKDGTLAPRECVACGCDLLRGSEGIYCASCLGTLKRELNDLAEQTGWPAQAVYEHEILYLAARQDGTNYAESLAGRSRLTLRRMKKKLHILLEAGYIQQTLTEEKGLLGYEFPEITYPKQQFHINMEVIRGYPASLMEEVEIKCVQILLALTALVFSMFAAVWLLKLPYPLVILVMIITAPILSILIWRHKRQVIDD